MSEIRGWGGPEWTQRGLNALKAMLDVDGATKRDMTQFLFDTGLWDKDKLSWTAAEAKWNANLNPATAGFFRLAEIWALAKRFERYELITAINLDLGLETRRIPTEERRQALLERLAIGIERSNELTQEAIAELTQQGTLKNPVRIHPVIHDGGGSFALPEAAGDDLSSGF